MGLCKVKVCLSGTIKRDMKENLNKAGYREEDGWCYLVGNRFKASGKRVLTKRFYQWKKFDTVLCIVDH